MKTVKATDLLEGDIVRLSVAGPFPYSTCTVKWVEHEKHSEYGASAAAIEASPIRAIHLFRPYVHVSDMITSGGVITYIGMEEFYIWPDSEVILLQESDVPEVKKARKAAKA